MLTHEAHPRGWLPALRLHWLRCLSFMSETKLPPSTICLVSHLSQHQGTQPLNHPSALQPMPRMPPCPP